jgi:hypothetical protein
MTSQEAKISLNNLQKRCETACEIARTAQRNAKSLAGHNYYRNKFHDAVIDISQSEARAKTIMEACRLEQGEVDQFMAYLACIKSTSANNRQRAEALKQVRMICQSVLVPRLENLSGDPTPKTEQVLPMSVVQGTRRVYLERIIQQANGCYENHWYDGCAVMMRRFVETMIIEVYEGHGKAAEIKDANGNFIMLRDLLNKFLNDPTWNLQRDTQKVLPEVKSLGDNSAHARRFIAIKDDVDKLLKNNRYRVAAEDLLHLANLK